MLTGLMHNIDLKPMPSWRDGLQFSSSSNGVLGSYNEDDSNGLLHNTDGMDPNQRDRIVAVSLLGLFSKNPYLAWDAANTLSECQFDFLLRHVKDAKVKFFLELSKALMPFANLHPQDGLQEKISQAKPVVLDYSNQDLRNLNTKEFAKYIAEHPRFQFKHYYTPNITVNFSGANLDRSTIEDLPVSSLNLNNSSLFAASLNCMRINNLNLDAANLILAEAWLPNNVSARNADIRYASFCGCGTTSIDLTGSNASIEVSLRYLSLLGEIARGEPNADLKLACKDLRGLDLRKFDLRDQNIAGAIIDQTTVLADNDRLAFEKLDSTLTGKKLRMANNDRKSLSRLYAADKNTFRSGVPNS